MVLNGPAGCDLLGQPVCPFGYIVRLRLLDWPSFIQKMEVVFIEGGHEFISPQWDGNCIFLSGPAVL